MLWLAIAGSHGIWRARRRPDVAPAILAVGSLRSGGTGKTDLAAWIATRHPELAVLAHPTGDEDAWLAEHFPGRVFVHRDFLAAWVLAKQAGFAAALCDGGLQDPALDDCPAICLDLEDAPSHADLLPFGRYRELSPRPRRTLLRLALERDLAPSLDAHTLPPRGTRVVAACAVARPEAFFGDLEDAGLVLVERLAFGDHRCFAAGLVRKTREKHPGIPWLVTAKDAARGELAHLPEGSIAIGRILSPNANATESVDALVETLRLRR